MRPDICMLTNVHHPLDPRIFHKEAQSLAEAGYGVRVLGPAGAEAAGRRGGIEVEVLPPPRSAWGRLANMARLLRRALRLRARCYHLHDPELLPLGLLLRGLGFAVVYDVHEHFPQAVQARPWVPARLRRPLGWLVERLERWLAARLSGVVGVVGEQGARFARAPFVAIANYPRLECFPPPPPGGERFELIHLGSLSAARGAFFLLEVARRLRRRHGSFRLLCLGDFHGEAARERFMQLRAEYGLCHQVLWRPGDVPYEELAAILARARIGLIPGQPSPQNALPFAPTKLFEYLACGLAVVASDLPSLRRLRAQAHWGYVVGADDAEAHAWAIGHLLAHPRAARAMGRRGRQMVEAQWNWRPEARKLAAFYAALLPRPEARTSPAPDWRREHSLG